jgi:hypothetical protein
MEEGGGLVPNKSGILKRIFSQRTFSENSAYLVPFARLLSERDQIRELSEKVPCIRLTENCRMKILDWMEKEIIHPRERDV